MRDSVGHRRARDKLGRELTVAAGFANGLIALAASKGAPEQALAERSGIELNDLLDPDSRIPMQSYIALMQAAKQLCNDPALALHYGETVDMSEVSIVGLIMNASNTMMDALVQLNRLGRLAVEVETISAGPRFALTSQGGALWMVDARVNPNEFPELGEGAFARLVCGPRRFLPRPHVLEVHFTHAAPTYRSEYDRIFQCPVVFDSHWNAMRLDPDLPAQRVALQPRYVFGILSGHAEALLKALEQSESIRSKVERLLLPILHTGDVSADVIAGELGLSRQTLYRRLKAEAVTFERVLDELRHTLALHYLTGEKSSVNETAYLAGFSDRAAFSRAFKRWTGRSPREARSPKP